MWIPVVYSAFWLINWILLKPTCNKIASGIWLFWLGRAANSVIYWCFWSNELPKKFIHEIQSAGLAAIHPKAVTCFVFSTEHRQFLHHLDFATFEYSNLGNLGCKMNTWPGDARGLYGVWFPPLPPSREKPWKRDCKWTVTLHYFLFILFIRTSFLKRVWYINMNHSLHVWHVYLYSNAEYKI